MQRATILHMFTPAPNLSPFDVNMAIDAGWQHCIPYTGLDVGQIPDFTQDAIFSRGPKGVAMTGVFVGGRDVFMAMDMLESARQSMVPPFEVSVFADPSGAFTTAAGMVACVERQLKAIRKTISEAERQSLRRKRTIERKLTARAIRLILFSRHLKIKTRRQRKVSLRERPWGCERGSTKTDHQ